MTLATHGDQKYHNSEKLAETSDWPTLSIEHRKFEAGRQATPVPICTEVILLLSGGGMVCRSGNGEVQKSLARPGMSYLVPVGTQENYLELSDRMECLHLYLPPTLLDQSALADFDIDPAKVQIAYADGLADPVLFHICSPLRDLLHRPRQPTDAMFVEGIQVALAAHFLAVKGGIASTDVRVESATGRSVVIHSKVPLPVAVESKVVGSTPARFRVLTGRLRVIAGTGDPSHIPRRIRFWQRSRIPPLRPFLWAE